MIEWFDQKMTRVLRKTGCFYRNHQGLLFPLLVLTPVGLGTDLLIIAVASYDIFKKQYTWNFIQQCYPILIALPAALSAGALFMGLSCVGDDRKEYRKRKKLCMKCGYKFILAEKKKPEQCPECGKKSPLGYPRYPRY